MREGLMLVEASGRVLHETPAIGRILADEWERDRVRIAMLTCARSLSEARRACGSELRPLSAAIAREIQVTRLLAAGRRNDDVAASLQISPHTARRHTERVLAKLGASSRAAVGALVRGT